tara:strand:+ start:2446 stop:2715 length:270 start_codon:yes stop_codon:yes gene_type:complete
MPFKGKRMNVFVKRYLEEIITSEPKAINTILDDLFIYLDKNQYRNQFKRIPTRGELIKYLTSNYDKVELSMSTGKPVKSNGIVHYFREG